MILRALLLFIVRVQKNNTFSFVSINSLLVYDRKDDMIRASLATTFVCNGPLLLWEFHPIKLQVIHMLIEGYERARNPGTLIAWLNFGDEYGGSPHEDLTFDTQQSIDGADRFKVMEEPMPPLPSIAATTLSKAPQ